ncbi:MAG: hypothetical protein H7329_12360 [Opitutaceae bacterium]|nr:hypothetical protein [Cytophagales bacterium]
MSAIFGILDLKGGPVNLVWIKSMQEDLAHRGPDGHGLYREHSLVLGHQLLQVTPESMYDKSPYEEDGFVITANARLDEREALMARLQIVGEEREKITDSILMLRSYRKWGKDFVKDIYGDFSFAIWDKEKKELFCARDQMGVKPLLYYFQDNRFVFSTELRAIVKLPFVKTEIDHSHLRDQVIGICDIPDRTSWKNIVRLRAASILYLSSSGIAISQYWEPEYNRNSKYKSEEQSALALREILERVIAEHTRVIGGVGVPLSGGLDSSTIACLAARKLALENKNLTTASSVLNPTFTETDIKDELGYIQTVLQQEKNIDSTFIYNTDLQFLGNLDEKFNRHYAPFNNSYYVDEALYNQFKLKSVRRVLSGYLGDITTSNSTIYPLPHLLLAGRFGTFFKLSRKMKKNMEGNFFSFIINNILIPVAPMFLLKEGYRFKGHKIPWDINNLPLHFSFLEKHQLQKRSRAYHKNYLVHQLQISRNIWATPWEKFEEDWDCGSSHHQIEITYPLLDRRVVEFLLQLPVEHFYSEGFTRGLIRKAMDGILPEKIKTRKDKYPYSPGYHAIIQRDILKIKALLMSEKLSVQMENMINKDKLISQLEKIVKSKTSRIFNIRYWELLSVCTWVAFSNWSLNKKR